ncbi:beta-ketoacyl-ACP synthase II [Marinactinospora thermotolerans]|uniref:3-oxoacyl-[acyl-carrier-protein] synthase 2 n=1 Tax=Marinactinospora thermotolerans DSM 45154 TaxID=1122192 RepID=A0A1T4S3P7_9ACTN|nr:beta-ketoacyl-ACP synthase II [Marinactinospora thermotolerans]SKA22920.1 3-oxoacyl-[acyl-carrier-protein] synthase II [Marinactinospora thermotolerans DSM 45154]
MSTTEVVVTGLGATTPLGGDVASTWSALLEGQSGIRTIEEDWVKDLPVHFAGAVAVEPSEKLPRHRMRRLDRTQQFALIAAQEAWEDAGAPEVDPLRLGAVVSSGIGGILTILEQYDTFREKGWKRVSPFTVPMLMPNSPAAAVSLEFSARAGAHAPVSACASSAEAIADAIAMIRSGRADIVIAGGTEAALHPLNIASFASMRALSTRNDDPQRASRPFDVNRDGFVMSEGAGIIVLESAEHARARGARVYAVAAGAGYSNDAHDIVQPDPAGTGQARAITAALADADLQPHDIAHVNAHATSTPAGDVGETVAIRSALGDSAADQVAVTSTKSMTGHLLGGAGAVESIATVLALYHGQIPPTINIDELDPGVVVDIVRDKPRDLSAGAVAALNESFGFGGHNVAVAFRRV